MSQLEHYKTRDPKARICARALCIHGNRVLVIQRFKYGESYMVLPGGGIDPGETDFEAATRELKEETSIDAEAIKLIKVLPATDMKSEQRIVLCSYIGGDPYLPETSEEAHRTDDGQNTYEPMWVSLEIAREQLVPAQLRELI